MFTGIVVGIGRVVAVDRFEAGCRLLVDHEQVVTGLGSGDSIAVDGACLTALEPTPTGFAADVSAETLRRTTLGARRPGDAVNLELPMSLEDLVGGHLVQGHVDGRGRLVQRRREGDSDVLRFSVPPSVAPHCVIKGSVAVNGVSLTISGLSSEWIEVTIIPHTSQRTNLSLLARGDEVNLEADLVSKYVERHLQRFLDRPDSDDDSR